MMDVDEEQRHRDRADELHGIAISNLQRVWQDSKQLLMRDAKRCSRPPNSDDCYESDAMARAWLWLVLCDYKVDPTVWNPALMQDRYRHLARRLHPDKGGNALWFQQLEHCQAIIKDGRGKAAFATLNSVAEAVLEKLAQMEQESKQRKEQMEREPQHAECVHFTSNLRTPQPRCLRACFQFAQQMLDALYGSQGGGSALQAHADRTCDAAQKRMAARGCKRFYAQLLKQAHRQLGSWLLDVILRRGESSSTTMPPELAMECQHAGTCHPVTDGGRGIEQLAAFSFSPTDFFQLRYRLEYLIECAVTHQQPVDADADIALEMECERFAIWEVPRDTYTIEQLSAHLQVLCAEEVRAMVALVQNKLPQKPEPQPPESKIKSLRDQAVDQQRQSAFVVAEEAAEQKRSPAHHEKAETDVLKESVKDPKRQKVKKKSLCC